MAKKKRPATIIVLAAIVAGAAAIGVTGARRVMREGRGGDQPACGEGFVREGARCLARAPCPRPLVVGPSGCEAPARDVVLVPATTVSIGPSDWEAEGRVRPRTLRAGPFEMDRLEVSVGRLRPDTREDRARAASGVDLDEARAFCRELGGRLPTEDEWIVAAAGERPRRYPWGDTGAVCRRAAWGLVRGPCGTGASGPDTVGAHPDGATPLGIHDLAGNVAEWVEVEPASDAPPGAPGGPSAPRAPAARGVVRGGSYETDLATDLRTWVRREVPAGAREPTIGFRCVYEVGVTLPAPQ